MTKHTFFHPAELAKTGSFLESRDFRFLISDDQKTVFYLDKELLAALTSLMGS